MKHLFVVIAALVLLSDCKKSTRFGDHFIFGISYGECGDNCVQYFMLRRDRLYADQMDKTGDRLKFSGKALSAEKRNLAKTLESDLPEFLKNAGSETFGCPDCHDQEAIYVALKGDSKTTKFKIDTDKLQIPLEIRLYVDEIMSVIDQM